MGNYSSQRKGESLIIKKFEIFEESRYGEVIGWVKLGLWR